MIKVIRNDGESIDRLIRRYNKARNKADLPHEILSREYFLPKSEKRRRKRIRAMKKRRHQRTTV